MPCRIGTLLFTFIFVCKFTLFLIHNKILNEIFDFLTFFCWHTAINNLHYSQKYFKSKIYSQLSKLSFYLIIILVLETL